MDKKILFNNRQLRAAKILNKFKKVRYFRAFKHIVRASIRMSQKYKQIKDKQTVRILSDFLYKWRIESIKNSNDEQIYRQINAQKA